MIAIAPRQRVHRGHVEAVAYLLDPAALGEAEARRRVLALWHPGVRVFQTPVGLLLQLPRPEWVDCSLAPGLPLTLLDKSRGSVWTALPLSAAEQAALAPPPGSVVLFHHGTLRVEPVEVAQQVDPARWLELGELRPFQVQSLGRPPAAATLTVETTREFDGRKSIPGVPAASTELRDVLFALQRAKEQAERARRGAPGIPVGGESAAGRVGTALGRALGGLLRDFQTLFPDRGTGGGAGGAGRGRVPSGPGAVPQDWELPFADRLSRVARRAAGRMISAFRLSGLIGRKHAEYVGKMLDMFERGDLTEALKHAIPLGSMPGMDHLPPSLGGLGPRADLSISPFMTPASSAIGVGGGFFQDLESIYRRAFQRLEQEGRIEEAAFVLAELLHANEEAVAFLERHGRYRLAAEIAEARELPPGLVIRQWFLAGDRDRAVAMARKLGAFADAVGRLEKSDPEKAKALRMLWADSLATSGDYTGAVEAAWPVVEARHLTSEWLARVLALGGIAAARMLPRRLVLEPEAWPEVRSAALALLEQDEAETAPERLALAEALRKAPPSPQTSTLARAAARALLRDGGAGLVHLRSGDYRLLVNYSGDGVLRTDLPELPSPKLPHLAGRPEPLEWNLTSADVGTLPVLDAALLPGGRTIVALGEAGSRLIARDGRTIAEFREPAHYLVVSDRGDRAIALARRGDAYRLARLDFLSRKSEFWCEAQLTTWAPDYDGSIWFAATRDGFLAVDATAPKLACLWRVNEVPGSIVTINRTPNHCSLLSYVHENRDAWGNPAPVTESWQRWTYQLPNLVLRRRENVEEGSAVSWNAVSADGTAAGTPRQSQQVSLFGPETYMVVKSRPLTMQALPGAVPLPPRFAPGWVLGGVAYPGGCTLHLVDETSLQTRASFTLGGASRVSYRFLDGVLTVADDRGRLLALDLEQGHRLRDLRLT